MIAYVTVGADDIARARRFYSAFLPALDYGLNEGPEGLSYAQKIAAVLLRQKLGTVRAMLNLL